MAGGTRAGDVASPWTVRLAAGLVGAVGLAVVGLAAYQIMTDEAQFRAGYGIAVLFGLTVCFVALGLQRSQRWAWGLALAGSGYFAVAVAAGAIALWRFQPKEVLYDSPGLLFAWAVQAVIAVAVLLLLLSRGSRAEFRRGAG